MEWVWGLLSAIFAAGGAWAAVRVELRALRHDVTRLEAHVDRAHERIDRLRSAGALVLLAAVLLVASPASAGGFITELGGGQFLKGSLVLDDDRCDRVRLYRPADPLARTHPCGGDGPLFVGWPVAWEFSNGATRLGWFHFSHWFNRAEETHFDCLCASHTFRWSALRNRSARRAR